MKLKALIESFQKALAELKAKTTAMLSKFPAPEQVQSSPEVASAMQGLRFTGERLAELGDEYSTRFGEALAGLDETIAAEAKALMTAQITAGELIEKATHEAALQAAKGATTDAVNAALSKRDTMDARRGQVGALLCGILGEGSAVDTAGLPEELLTADDAAFAAHLTLAKTRAEELKGLSALTPALAVRVAGLKADADGTAAYDALCGLMKSARGEGGATPPRRENGAQFAAVQAGAPGQWDEFRNGY